ncbi:MAG: glycosyltransferase, partial [Verrucomicrobiota bacterium]
MRLAYLFSRYPVVSQTFCDTEILALEKLGVDLELYSIYPPPTSFRHGHAARMRSSLHYAPATQILKLGEIAAKREGRWPEKLIAEHDRRYGKEYKAALRARNALYFADLFKARDITHFHVHFANRAAHTAIFIKAISGIPFSISTHGQDFMVDLGNDQLLAEICREAEFIANETEFSKGLVRDRCPDSEGKMLRVFNGMDLGNFPKVAPTATPRAVPRIVSTGRLIEFKGFHHLVAACDELKKRGLPFECEIIGEGPWRAQLQTQIERLGVNDRVRLLGSLPQEEVFGKLRGCDIFTLPCIVDRNGASDVFPTVILEAMASSRPVVSTRLAGVPEQIEHGQSGLLVEPGDERALANALADLLESPALRQQYGEAARRRIETEFAVDCTVLPLKAMFDKFVKPLVAPPRISNGWACLLNEWPGSGEAAQRTEDELRQLQTVCSALRVYAVNTSGSVPDAAAKTLRPVEFLPDAMVIEGEWQQERELARQIET